MTDLQETLRLLVADQPAVPDWPGRVRLQVRRRRQARGMAAAGSVALAMMGSVMVTELRREPLPVVLSSPATSSGPAEPPNEAEPVVVFLDLESNEVPAGVPIDLIVVARGFLDGAPSVRELIVDGRQEAFDVVPGCIGFPPGETEPPVRRERTEVTRTFTRTFSPGSHVVVVRASADCSRPGGSASRTYEVVAQP